MCMLVYIINCLFSHQLKLTKKTLACMHVNFYGQFLALIFGKCIYNETKIIVVYAKNNTYIKVIQTNLCTKVV